MKKTILLVLALVLVSGFVYAANVSGKLEAKAQVGFGEAGQPFANNGVFTFEPNITGAVDEYNSVTIELRLFGDVIETNSRDGSVTDNLKQVIGTSSVDAGTSVQTGSFFINSDIAGALGWTESTGGLNLKVKAGYFGPETTEVGQVKSIVESSDGADFSLDSGGGSEFTVGYTDYINVLVGLKYGDDNEDPGVGRFGAFVNPYGKAVLGPGTLEYSAYFGHGTSSNTTTVTEDVVEEFTGPPKVDDMGDPLTDNDGNPVPPDTFTRTTTRDVTITNEVRTNIVGGGLEYNNIALGGDLSLGIGGEFNYDLDNSSYNYGANLVLDVSNWLDVDLAFGGNNENAANDLGIGLGVNNPSGTLGLTIETEIGLTDTNSRIRINPDLWFKAGAATFTFGVDLKDINDPDGDGTFGGSVADLIISLSF